VSSGALQEMSTREEEADGGKVEEQRQGRQMHAGCRVQRQPLVDTSSGGQHTCHWQQGQLAVDEAEAPYGATFPLFHWLCAQQPHQLLG
jgi:hypothetical protein